jgi:hypothetical protein
MEQSMTCFILGPDDPMYREKGSDLGADYDTQEEDSI